jgi:hypothetical protein
LTARVGAKSFGDTERRDAWQLEPTLVVIALLLFVAYSTWAAFFGGENFEYHQYLSPFFSPYLRPSWWPPLWTTAVFVLWIPLGFRASCYYYRRAYYRSFFRSPAACAVSEVPGEYTGETGPIARYLPILHRWFLYLSLIVLVWLWIDAIKAFSYNGQLNIGVGTIVMLVNVVALSFFTLGCHALRSLVGGNRRCFSCGSNPNNGKTSYTAWSMVTRLTNNHKLWAWVSLFSVGLTDLYIRLCAMGVIPDIHLIGAQ